MTTLAKKPEKPLQGVDHPRDSRPPRRAAGATQGPAEGKVVTAKRVEDLFFCDDLWDAGFLVLSEAVFVRPRGSRHLPYTVGNAIRYYLRDLGINATGHHCGTGSAVRSTPTPTTSG